MGCKINVKTKLVLLGIGNFNDAVTYPVPWDNDIGYKSEFTKEYNVVLKDLAHKYNASLIDVANLITLDDLYDGVHPNTQGHEKIFNAVWELVSGLL